MGSAPLARFIATRSMHNAAACAACCDEGDVHNVAMFGRHVRTWLYVSAPFMDRYDFTAAALLFVVDGPAFLVLQTCGMVIKMMGCLLQSSR